MNAYELAEKLYLSSYDTYHEESANMLRQQADRIAELEKKLQEAALDYISVCSQADEHYARVQELEQQLEHYKNKADYLDKREWELLKQTKPLSDEEIVETLADLEHQQWMAWADSIMKSEKISDNRFARWASLMIPYAELSEEMKEHDRVWARKVLRAIEERHGIK